MGNYIASRTAELGLDSGATGLQGTGEDNDVQKRYEALRADYVSLKAQLEKASAAPFKSAAQTAFEASPECEQILSVFFNRFMRDKYMAEFQTSPHLSEFQEAANVAYEQFEKTYKSGKKEAPQNGQTGEKNPNRTSKTPAGKNA